MTVTTTTKTVREHEITLAGEQLVAYINEALGKGRRRLPAELTLEHAIPDDAEVKVYVPGGGDWSCMDLDLCGRSPDSRIVIRWTTSDTDVATTTPEEGESHD